MLKKVEDYEVINEITEKCIIIKVKQEIVDQKGLYDAVRMAWKLNIGNAQKADYIIVVTDTIVKEIYKNVNWDQTENERYQFTAWVADDDIREKYIYKRIPQKFREKGMQYPCLYTFDK